MQKIKVGFLGCGNIGGGVWMLLEDMRHDFAVKHQISFEVKKMLVRALDEKRAVEVPLDRLTTNVNEIIDDPEISLVCEFMGGEQPAAQFMLAALKAGKHVVTANKMALSLHWQELHQAAAENNVGLYYEASVCGAIPVIRTIRESMTGSRVDRIGGIVNGTTNYILTQMSEHGLSYQVALAQAQELGLAEPDPSSDVEGHDAAYKLCILSALCLGKYIHPQKINCCGISSVDIIDVFLGKQLGYSLKLLARAQLDDNEICCSVSPTFVRKDSQLSNVNGAFNGILLHGHASDDIFLYGRGAGALPTASAIVGDMIQAAQLGACKSINCEEFGAAAAPSSAYYIRVPVEYATQSILCAAELLGKDNVTMHTLTDNTVHYCILTTGVINEEQRKKLCSALLKIHKELVCWPIEGNV